MTMISNLNQIYMSAKRKLNLGVAVVILCSIMGLVSAMFTGCKTTTTIGSDGSTNVVSSLDPVKVSEGIKVLIAAGVPFAIQQDANSVPYLRAAAVVFKAAANSGDYDPAQLDAALKKISVKELRDPQARALVIAVLGVYKVTLADAVNAKLNQSDWAIPVLNAIADGLDSALPPDTTQ